MEEEEESSNPRKKLRLTKEQSRLLEESFKQNHTLINPVTLPSSFYSFLSHHYIDRCLLIFCCLTNNNMHIGFAEAERVFGNAAEAPTKASGGVVSEP